MTKQRFFLITVFIIFIIGILPILSMVIDTFITQEAKFTLSYYIKFIKTSSLIKSFQNSILLSLVVTLFSTFFGVILGIIVGKTDISFKKIYIATLLIPLIIPPYILAFGWFELLGRDGVLGELLFGFFGTSFVLFSIYLPIPMLLTIFFLNQIDPKLEEAGRLVVGWSGVLRYITTPLITPAIIISSILIFILSFGEISVANFLRYDIISLESFVQFSAFYDFKMAIVSAMPLILISLIIVFMERFFINKNIYKFNSYQKIEYIKLGKYQKKITFLVSIFVTTIVIIPLSAIIIKSFSLSSFIIAFNKALEPLLRSIFYASIGATILMIFGFLNGYIIKNRVFRWWKLWDSSIILLFALPSSAIGIALILFWNKSYTNFIYSTPIIVIFGYLIKYLALSTKIIEIKLFQIPNSLVQSAQMVGAKWYQILYFIIMPLSKDILIISWIIGFIFCLRETTITMLLYPAGSDTLPIYIITQMANGKPEIIASLSLIMIITTLLPLAIWGIFNRGKLR